MDFGITGHYKIILQMNIIYINIRRFIEEII